MYFMKRILPLLFFACFFACNNNRSQNTATASSESLSSSSAGSSSNTGGHWEGNFSNGMKGAKISFDISDDQKELKQLTFQG